MRHDIVIGMAGSGGDGIVSAGEALIRTAALGGYYAVLTKSFGSQIRGGESSCRLRLSTSPVLHAGGTLDVAVALNWSDFLRFGAELPVGGRTVVIYDSASGVAPDRLPLPGVVPAEALAVPIGEMARSSAGTDRAKNTVVLGLLSGWLGLDRDGITEGIRKKLGRKGDDLLADNLRAFEAGIEHAANHPLSVERPMAPPPPSSGAKLLLDGNQMCAAAAIFAGCQFFGGYPITPSTEIMELLERELPKHGGTVLQAEDEIAGVGAAVGASYAGKKSMTATSGPGMSLKTEMLGLATMAELPLVCVNVQRGGPSTGLPTKSEQSDLFQAIFSGHGDVTRPVLAPTSVSDTFATTVEAFNVAERYQTPVILLSDQEIGQRKETVDPIDLSRLRVEERRWATEADIGEDYARFRVTQSRVSPISRPGMAGGNYLASGIEHDEHGAPTVNGEIHARMSAKRHEKMLALKRRGDLFSIEGDEGAPLALVAWGSLAGVARDARELARTEGLRVKLLVPRLVYPVAEEIYRDFFASVRAGLVVEQSYQGQLYRVLRMFVDVPPGVESLAQSASSPIAPGDVCARLRTMAQRLHHHVSPGTDQPE